MKNMLRQARLLSTKGVKMPAILDTVLYGTSHKAARDAMAQDDIDGVQGTNMTHSKLV